MRKPSEENFRTEFCDGPLLDQDGPVSGNSGMEVSDRAELIERLKRGESPTWVRSRELEKHLVPNGPQPQTLAARSRQISSLLPAFEPTVESSSFRAPARRTEEPSETQLSPPIDIERPRSALHSGNFTFEERERNCDDSVTSRRIESWRDTDHTHARSPPLAPWFPPAFSTPSPFESDPRFPPPQDIPTDYQRRSLRSQAPSLHSSSFVLKPPTSPLVQQSNNNDLDVSSVNLSSSPEKVYRRHTLPPQSFPTLSSAADAEPLVAQTSHDPSYLISPYRSHQPRKSLTSNWSLQAATSPLTPPHLRSRRPSLSSEANLLHHASMVGSYEESILHGRMSTGPSKPLDFTAQIGALGKGVCKPKYPAHVTVPFPAVFYSWSTGNGAGRTPSNVDVEPSPYVGHIDLEHFLPPAPMKEKRRKRRDHLSDDAEASGVSDSNQEQDSAAVNAKLRIQEKRKRSSPSPKAPLGGSYRIPQRGQLQIVIKNPNKTAVKLFLVPYDLEGMEPGTKTFIRQRCFSAGPIIENPLTSNKSPLSNSINQSKQPGQDSSSKPTLRYLIHLNICCPSKGRFFLYQHIRVVFANRVPDNKENLRNEIQTPEPRYSVYKPSRDSPMTLGTSAGAKLAAEKAQRRRSYGYGFAHGLTYDAIDGFGGGAPARPFNGVTSSFSFADRAETTPPVPAIPFHLTKPKKALDIDTHPLQTEGDDPMDLSPSSRPPTSSTATGSDTAMQMGMPQSPLGDKTNRLANAMLSPSSYRSSSSLNNDNGYGKLSRGDAGYGGVYGRPNTPEPREGLLAKKLRAHRSRDGEES
ncbi:MAG: hypothetical protein MMC33_007568 [Icmadophila ericetorum]|nr:hypothetical protein [Icmadophila ericetorum]